MEVYFIAPPLAGPYVKAKLPMVIITDDSRGSTILAAPFREQLVPGTALPYPNLLRRRDMNAEDGASYEASSRRTRRLRYMRVSLNEYHVPQRQSSAKTQQFSLR